MLCPSRVLEILRNQKRPFPQQSLPELTGSSWKGIYLGSGLFTFAFCHIIPLAVGRIGALSGPWILRHKLENCTF